MSQSTIIRHQAHNSTLRMKSKALTCANSITTPTELVVHEGFTTSDMAWRLEDFWRRQGNGTCLSQHPLYLDAVARGLQQRPIFIEAIRNTRTCGVLALSYVQSLLFGRYLVSLPYLNYGGVLAEDDATSGQLIDRAIRIADECDVRYLELRHQRAVGHPRLNHTRTDKIHMYLGVPATVGQLWDQLKSGVRNQIRKGQKQAFSAHWGGLELLDDYYRVFSENMRDLGTPVFSKNLFRNILQAFSDRTELIVVRDGNKPIAAALLTHGLGITEVPSASSLRSYNRSCANMLMYWHLLERAVERGQEVFDFGRTNRDSNTFRFKKQWGAEPVPANWQYYLREGNPGEHRKENPRYERFIRLWKKMPLWVTRIVGPRIVRGIP